MKEVLAFCGYRIPCEYQLWINTVYERFIAKSAAAQCEDFRLPRDFICEIAASFAKHHFRFICFFYSISACNVL